MTWERCDRVVGFTTTCAISAYHHSVQFPTEIVYWSRVTLSLFYTLKYAIFEEPLGDLGSPQTPRPNFVLPLQVRYSYSPESDYVAVLLCYVQLANGRGHNKFNKICRSHLKSGLKAGIALGCGFTALTRYYRKCRTKRMKTHQVLLFWFLGFEIKSTSQKRNVVKCRNGLG
jgi:hypothetical protein